MILETYRSLEEWRKGLEGTLVVTNGCFDVIHAGHVDFLTRAKDLGDLLLVGLNCDDSVRRLKGENRPIYSQGDRANILTALRCVDAVFIYGELTAEHFIVASEPNVYVKGGDYSIETVNESSFLQRAGLTVKFLPFLEGRSTTKTLLKLDSK